MLSPVQVVMLAAIFPLLQAQGWFVAVNLQDKHCHPSGPQKVSKVHSRVQPLLVQDSALWTLYSAERFYQVPGHNGDTSKETGNPCQPIPRHLADRGMFQEEIVTALDHTLPCSTWGLLVDYEKCL